MSENKNSNNNEILPELNENDVISFLSPSGYVEVYKVHKIKDALAKAITSQELGIWLNQRIASSGVSVKPGEVIDERWQDIPAYWITEGVDCELLKSDTPGWQKGKIKVELTVRYISDSVEPSEETETPTDSPEYPLDDIRRSIETQDA